MMAGPIATRLGSRATLIASLAVAAVGAVLVAIAVAPDGAYATLVPGLVVFGLGQGTTYTLMFAAATAGVAADDQGVASGMASTTQQVGGAVGLAILIGVASSGTSEATGEALSIAVTDGLQAALLAVAAGILLTLLAALRFRRPAAALVRIPQLGSPGSRPGDVSSLVPAVRRFSHPHG
jgi:MFS family permease